MGISYDRPYFISETSSCKEDIHTPCYESSQQYRAFAPRYNPEHPPPSKPPAKRHQPSALKTARANTVPTESAGSRRANARTNVGTRLAASVRRVLALCTERSSIRRFAPSRTSGRSTYVERRFPSAGDVARSHRHLTVHSQIARGVHVYESSRTRLQ